jgi:SAM-dependent methyltransferase
MSPRRTLIFLVSLGVVVAVGAVACARRETTTPHTPEHGHGHDGHTPAHHHRFDDAARWAQQFEAPERDAWQQPDRVLARMSLQPEHRVADIGAGTGYFATRAARAVTRGRVWAVDIEPSMVRYLNERARRENLDNLFSILGSPSDPLLPEAVDVVLVVDTWHHIDGRVAYFANVRNSLRPGGRVVIVDFKRDSPEGPPVAMRVPPEEVRRDMEEAGYAQEGEVTDLPRQYVMVFRARQSQAA